MRYNCPVCNFSQLESPPRNYTICRCCGTEFDYDDSTLSHAQLRDRWIQNGMRWHSRRVNPPVDWNPIVQLLKGGYGYQLNARRDATEVQTIGRPAVYDSDELTIQPVEPHQSAQDRTKSVYAPTVDLVGAGLRINPHA